MFKNRVQNRHSQRCLLQPYVAYYYDSLEIYVRPADPARPRYSVTLHVTLHWLGYLHRSWRAETTGIDVSQRAEPRPRGHRYMAQPETTSCHAPVTLSGGGRMRVRLFPSTLILPTCGCTSPLRRLTCYHKSG